LRADAVPVRDKKGTFFMAEDDALEVVQSVLEYRFQTPDLLESALTHSSVAVNRLASNERLEFLGDAVLGLVVCEELFARYPKYLEGDMTRVKSVVVSRDTCALIANDLGIVQFLNLGKGMSGAADLPSSLAACAYEALIGAIYLDGGLEPARRFILKGMLPQIECVVAGEHHLNYKSILQQYAQRVLGGTPQYELQDEKGPDHAKAFEIAVAVRGRRFPSAWGPSKKSAEQRAAYEALRALGQVEDRSPPEEDLIDDDDLGGQDGSDRDPSEPEALFD
jgi:ribonuclease-3